MNKRQKEVAQAQLDAEKATLKQLERHYKRALNDLNLKIQLLQSDELTVSRVYRIEHQKALKAQVEAILEKLHSDEYTTISQFLSDSYTDAFIGNAYDMFGQGVPLILPIDPKEAVAAIQTESKLSEDLYTSLGVDTDRLKKTISAEISRGIASDMAYEDIARNIASVSGAPLSRAKTIATTEAHRIQQAGFYDNQKKAKSKGADILRQWNSTLDGGTRDTHRKLDGQLREMDEPFEMDGKKAMYPGDFGDPAEDCNCRCRVNQRARWALGAKELHALEDRAEFFGLDKTKDFEDFKKKYLKYSKVSIENLTKSGTISLRGLGFQFFANKGIPKQTDKQITKSIASWNKVVTLHQDKVNNPEKYDKDWATKSDRAKSGLIKHWQHEIKTAQSNIDEANEILKNRGRNDG